MQAYISNYTSHTRIDRLLFISDRNKGTQLELEALKLAADELKQVSILATQYTSGESFCTSDQAKFWLSCSPCVKLSTPRSMKR